MKRLPISLAVAALLASPLAMAKTVDAVASFSILGDIVKQVGGDHVKVSTLVGPDGDPHSFEPSPQDGKTLAQADVVFVSGLGLEGWIDRLVSASGYKGQVITASQGINTRQMEEDGKPITDPHAWNSMKNGVQYATNVMNALIAGQINLAWLSGFSYCQTFADSKGGVEPLVAAAAIDGSMGYNAVIVVRADSPYKTIDDFVKAARAKPGGLTVGGTATLTEDHIFTYLFEKAAGISVKYVPFNSGGEVTAALMGGHIDAAVENPNEIVAQVDAGKAKNLAVAARKRLKDAPNIPTFAEKGWEFYWEQMRGVVGPADMPAEAVKWWQDTLKKVVATPKWQEGYIKKNLLTPVDWVGEEANKYLDGLRGKYEQAYKDLGAKK